MSNIINRIIQKISLLFLIIFIISPGIHSANLNIITLPENETSYEEVLTRIESEIIYINGSLTKNKTYLLISSTNEISESSPEKSLSPLLFVSKNKTNLEYDYTSISQSNNFGNKLSIPYTYLDKNGFYLNITCESRCIENTLKFEAVDEIDLDVGEKFSYFSKDEPTNNLVINLDVLKYDFENMTNLVLVVSGGEPKQISMKTKKIKAKKMFGDIYYISMTKFEMMQNYIFLGDNIKIFISANKNVKFTFKSFFIFNEEEIKNNVKDLYEGEYNQYLALQGNRIECFNVQILNEKKEESLNIPREILVLGKNNFQINITCDIKGATNKMFFEKINEFDDYVISDGLNCQSSVKNICIKPITDDLEIIQVHIHKRINEENTNNKIIRRMHEPLLNDITYRFTLNEENSSDTSNNHINIHSHSQFYEQNENNKDIVGLNVGIQVLYGIIKVYRDVCETYPYCSLSKQRLNFLVKNETIDSTFETINGEGGYYSTSIYSIDDTYSMNTKQNIIIVLCKDNNFDGCAYQITYYNMQSYKKLYSGSTITKYLSFYNLDKLNPKKDNYELYLHKNKKIVLDLVVYSGDAYITPITQKDGCVFEEHHLGSNERRIITCKDIDDETDEINGYTRVLFDIKANNNSAFYSIYALEKEEDDKEDAWPMEMTIMESIHDTKRVVKVLGKYLNDPPRKANSNFVAIFNSLNCDLRVKNLNTSSDYSSEENDDIIQDVTRASKRLDIFYEIKKRSDFHIENKNCLYFVSSFDMNNEDSGFIIPEAKPFRFRLDYEIDILRVNFPYVVNENEKNKNVFLRVNLLNNIPIKVKIQVGFLPPKEHILYYSKNIQIISNKNKLKKNSFTKIKISIETFNKDDDAIIDFSIRTNSPIPYSIKTEKYFSDLTLNNNIQYYMSLVKQDSEGEILVNFKRNVGQVYAKLVREDKLREVSGWGDRYIIPNNIIDKRLLLPYDPNTQKVSFTKAETNNCDKYCYLIFGVDANDNSNLKKKDNKNDYFVPYNLYLKYTDQNETETKFIDLQNNEYITNYLKTDKNDYYQYHIFDFFNNDNINKVIFDFESENCELKIGFNNDNFSDPNHTISFNKNSLSTKLELTKKEIDKYYIKDTEIDYYSYSDDLYLYFEVKKKKNLDKLLDVNELDLLYTLRANSPSYFAENVNIINNVQPNNCYFTDKINYCDYIMKLESLNPQMIIEIFALTNNFKNIYIFANAISSDEFGEYIKEHKLPEWPNVYNNSYDFPEDEKKRDNYLSINYKQLESKIDNLIDSLLLIRVYGELNTTARIITSMRNDNNNKENIIIPSINKEEIYSVGENKSLIIKLPNDDNYICKLIPMKGKGNITYHNKKYILDGNYEPLVFNTVKGGDNSLKIESIDYTPKKNKTDDFPFKFSLKFTKMKKEDLTEVDMGNNNFAYENVNFPLKYYTDISDIKDNDISFDAFLEDFGYIYNDNEVSGTNTRLKNNTEDFTIKSYLLNEDELNEVIKNNGKVDSNKTFCQGTFDIIHRTGNVHIPKDNLNKFISDKKNKNKKVYLYTTVNKAYNNRNNYSFLKSKINLILPENPKNQVPYDTYILGYIKGNSTQAKNKERVNHKYKLNLASINEENSNLKLEFTSTNKETKFDIVNLSPVNNHTTVNPIKNTEKYGKKISIIKPEKITDDLYLTVDSPVKDYDTEYTFKYSLLNNYKDESLLGNNTSYPYDYKPKVTKCNTTNSSNSYTSYIKFDKIKKITDPKKNKTTNCNCNYYISVYEKNKNGKKDTNDPVLENNTISIKKNDAPYATYKVSNDSKDDFIETNIHVYTNDDIYYEIIGEDKDTKELFGYNKRYPGEFPEDKDGKDGGKNPKKKGKGFDWLLFILILLGIILIIITICLCCKYCCNSKEKKSKPKKKDTINLNLEQNETLYENPLLEDQIKS